MSIRVGDSVFIRNGQTGIVKARNDASGTLTLDTDLKTVQQETRNGFLNGMTPETREEFNKILDGVKGGTEEPKERVEALQKILGEIEEDPTRHALAGYVRSEMLHIMNTHGIKPRQFSMHESKAR